MTMKAIKQGPAETPSKRLRRSAPDVDAVIDTFRDKCLEIVREVQASATAEIDRLTRENEELRARPTGGTSQAATNELLIALETLGKQVSEKDARIDNLLRILNERDSELAANDHETLSEKIATLENELRLTQEARDSAESELSSLEERETELEKEVADLEKKIEDLEEKLGAEPMAIAIAVHDYLRDERLLPAHLDAPLRVLPHGYLCGMLNTIGAELPEI